MNHVLRAHLCYQRTAILKQVGSEQRSSLQRHRTSSEQPACPAESGSLEHSDRTLWKVLRAQVTMAYSRTPKRTPN